MIIHMLFSLLRLNRIQNLEQTEKNIRNTERRKLAFPKEYVENTDLYNPVLKKIMTTRG